MRNIVAEKQLNDCVGELCLEPKELLKNFRQSLIDPDTPQNAMWRESADGKKLKLVVSIDDWISLE